MISSMPMPTNIPTGHAKVNVCGPKIGATNGYIALPKVTIPSGGAWTAAEEKALLEPYTYLASAPGKGVRKLLVDALNVWLQVPTEQLVVIANIVDMLHLSSLMIDDIEDSSELRRGNPAAHHVYGVPQTINTAEYVFVQAIGEVAKLRATRPDNEPGLHKIVNGEVFSV